MDNFSFMDISSALFLTLLAGLSTAIGASFAFFSSDKNHKVLSIGLGFSAGVMIYVSFVEILQKSKLSFLDIFQNQIQAEFLTLLCFFGGIGLSALIDRLIPEDVNPHEPRSDEALGEIKEGAKISKTALKRTGIFTALAIGIHNFPEGFATFIASLQDFTLGISIALAIAIHNIPEGMAISLPIYHATGDRKKAFFYAVLSGLAEPIGAIVGFFLLLPLMGMATLGVTFGVVAGIMIYISFDELLPSARVYGNAHTTIAGIVSGMFVMAISLVAFKI
ncbi:MAG: zinc transporter ZupT [Sulfurospirillaceae bacterium]|nr:zinc transporter ZupT [Sulfurospirillaceae bacterium]